MSKPVILTGLRANNDLTLGNYLGALLPLIDMAKTRANEYDVHIFVPDLHSFTTPIDHGALYQQTIDNLRIYAAAGLPLNHPGVHIYRQSYVPAHSELTWILDCFTYFGEMRRMTQFKDKSATLMMEAGSGSFIPPHNEEGWQEHDAEMDQKMEKSVSVGLFNYPVLMAADILLYDASYVPVGDDQTQHLEYTRDIAMRMNNRFGKLFTVPESVPKQHEFFGKDQGLRIRDLQDPNKKMSKSDETGKGVIFLNDSIGSTIKKIMSAATDSYSDIQYDMAARPGISNLLQILSLLSGQSMDKILGEWKGQSSYGDLKKAVASQVEVFLIEFQKRLAVVDENALLAKLIDSETKMNEIANQTLLRTQKAVGLRPHS